MAKQPTAEVCCHTESLVFNPKNMRRQLLLLTLAVLATGHMVTGQNGQNGQKKRLLREIMQKVMDLQDQVEAFSDRQSAANAAIDGKLQTITDQLDSLPDAIRDMVESGAEMILDKINKTCGCGKQYGKLIRDDEGYFLAFRLTAGISVPAYRAYMARGQNDDEAKVVIQRVPCGCRSTNGSLWCDRHYRSRLMDLWQNLPVKRVKVALYDNGVEQRRLVFDGVGSTITSFFTPERLLSTSYTDLATTATNFFSIEGHASVQRRFFINHAYGGCPSDVGWMMVADQPDGPCNWEKEATYSTKYPVVLYSSSNVKGLWETGSPALADVLTVSIKLGDKADCYHM